MHNHLIVMNTHYHNGNIALEKYIKKKSCMYNPYNIHITCIYMTTHIIYTADTCLCAILRHRKNRIIGKKMDTKHRQRCMLWIM